MSTTRREEGKKVCPFCNLEKIQVEMDFGDVVVFQPLNPVTKGHILVVPKRHVKDFSEDPQTTAKVMQIAAELVQEMGGEYNLITSKGKNATQSVHHLHVHLVRRTERDGLLLPWSNQIIPSTPLSD